MEQKNAGMASFLSMLFIFLINSGAKQRLIENGVFPM